MVADLADVPFEDGADEAGFVSQNFGQHRVGSRVLYADGGQFNQQLGPGETGNPSRDAGQVASDVAGGQQLDLLLNGANLPVDGGAVEAHFGGHVLDCCALDPVTHETLSGGIEIRVEGTWRVVRESAEQLGHDITAETDHSRQISRHGRPLSDHGHSAPETLVRLRLSVLDNEATYQLFCRVMPGRVRVARRGRQIDENRIRRYTGDRGGACGGPLLRHTSSLKGRVLQWGLMSAGLLGLISTQLVGGHPAVADSAPADPGSAIATASLLGAVPIVGNTNLSVSAGASQASYQDTEARSSAQTLDLGGLGVVLANTPFCGTFALPASEQPQPLTDDSVGGKATDTNNLPGAGTESVTASAAPEGASGTTTPVGQVIPGLLAVEGDSSTAVSYLSSGEREAQSTDQVNLNIAGGLVELGGLTWSAVQHTGNTAVSQGSFTIDFIKVGPTTITAPAAAQMATVEALANTALQTVGLTLVMPTVKTDPATGTVTVTPLEITVGKSALSNTLLLPLIQQSRVIETDINAQSTIGDNCANDRVLLNNLLTPAETVGNVALGVFTPGGGFDLDVGGVTADTLAPTAYADPFGAVAPTFINPSLPPLTNSDENFSLLPSGPTSTSPTPPSTTIPAQAAPSTLTSATHCDTTSPSGHPGCWSGDADVVGGAAVVAGGLLFLADLRKSRRSRRLKEAVT